MLRNVPATSRQVVDLGLRELGRRGWIPCVLLTVPEWKGVQEEKELGTD
jgi:hypothetical protein